MKKLLILLLLMAAPALAQTVQINVKQLQKYGVAPRTFATLYYVDALNTLIGYDVPNFDFKRRGILARVWTFKMDSTLKMEKVTRYDLEVGLEQLNLTPDAKSAVIFSKHGTEVYRLDFADGKLTTLMTHEQGKPGFLIDAEFLSQTEGRLYTVGTTYDAEDYAGERTLVEVQPDKTGPAAFVPVQNLKELDAQVPNLRMASMLSPKGMFFIQQGQGEMVMSRWTPAGGLQPYDRFKSYLGSWGESTRIFCATERQDGTFELALGDAATGERRVIAAGPQRLLYPVVSKDANALTYCSEPVNGKVDIYVATDQDGFKPRQLLSSQPPATLRLSIEGKVLVTYSRGVGLTLARL